jgi:2-octaprenyl-6-methoxyphenol hydroxylase
MQQSYDILIIGGGMVGASLARALSDCRLKIGVVEPFSFDTDEQPSYDERVIALAYGSKRILEAMGSWEQIGPNAEPIRQVHISDRGHFGVTRIDHTEEGVEALGYVVAARALGQDLSRQLQDAENIDLLCPARFHALHEAGDHIRTEILIDGTLKPIKTRLLVAADGGNSLVRKQLEIPVREKTYGQTGIIANITPAKPGEGIAYERFTDSGPLAMLPMTENRYSLVWTAWDDDVEAIMGLEDADFLEGVQQRFGYRLGRLVKTSRRIAYPLKQMMAEELIRPQVVLIGNAAHTVHPVTGQGYNLGIRDVAVLAEVILDSLKAGGDIGGLNCLQRYAEWRQPDHKRVAEITDSLALLFANPWSPLSHARSLGLVGLDLLPGIKHLVARQFMGLGGKLPRLARGLPLV